ncbi:SNX2B [Scenedesmus sp. PABB004]|nr:SNX2B [Scenedesmus sp. PABB004]
MAAFSLDDSPPPGAPNPFFGAGADAAPAAPGEPQQQELGLATISLTDDESDLPAPAPPARPSTAGAAPPGGSSGGGGGAPDAAAPPGSGGGAPDAAAPPGSSSSSGGGAPGAVPLLPGGGGAPGAVPLLPGGGGAPDAAPPLGGSDPSELQVKVWVRDPERGERRGGGGVGAALGGGGGVTYLVRTHTTASAYVAASPAAALNADGLAAFDVRRRFADFSALHGLLRAHHRGLFLPPLPDKGAPLLLDGVFERNTFLRRADLQAYICAVANHPALVSSEELVLFLTSAGDLAVCARWQQLAARPTPALDMLMGLLGQQQQQQQQSSQPQQPAGGGGLGVMARMRHSLLSAVQPRAAAHELSAEELQLRQAKESLNLVGHLEASADDFGDLGRAFNAMARSEEAAAARQGRYTAAGSGCSQRAADLQQLGFVAARHATVEKQFVLRGGAALVFLHDWAVLVPEAVATLEEREAALDAVHRLADELADKRGAAARAAAALGPAAPGDRRLAALGAAADAVQARLDAARQTYALLKDRNESELVRLSLQQALDYRQHLRRFAAAQAQVAAAAAELWGGLAEALGSEGG